MNFFQNTYSDQEGNTLEYAIYGSGMRVLLYFPGFGETYESARFLAEQLTDYRVTAINQYGLGRSKRVSQPRYLKPKEWEKTMKGLLDELQVDRFSVLGFSLGGRFAATTFSFFHHRMDHLIMVAPDAIVKRFTYELSTFPIFFRQLFYFLMKNPRPYFVLVNWMKALRLINPYVANFSIAHMKSEFNRMLVYRSWVTFKYLRVPQKKLIPLLNDSNIQSLFILGEKDKIISPKRHLEFLSKLTQSQVLILPYGHNKLVDNASTEILKTLNY